MSNSDNLQQEAIKEGIRNALAEKKKTDPLAGIKFGSTQLNDHIMAALKTERGIHFESFLCVLGSLGGYACQICARENLQKGPRKDNDFVVVTDKDGKEYYFGDLINSPLVESNYSIWSFVAGALQNLGKVIPEITDIFKHVSDTIGTENFGIPRVPEGHSPGRTPLQYLNEAGAHLFPIAKEYCDTPEELPALFGIAIQQAIFMGKDTLDPVISANLIMECAIPMSKVNLL